MATERYSRRGFLALAGRRGTGLGLAATSLPAILAVCGGDDGDGPGAAGAASPSASPQEVAGTAIVADVLDFALTSPDWQGAFGWVRLRLHPAVVDGGEAWFIRTDASDETYARDEGLVYVPKIAGLSVAGAAGEAYLFANGADGQPAVLSGEPGHDDYSPAWRINEVTWSGSPTLLESASDVLAAADAGDLTIASNDVIANMPVVQWAGGGMPVDSELVEYLGGGQLIEAPDTAGGSVLFKLHECFPGSRYIVCDTSAPPMAEGMAISGSPGLATAPEAGATGRVNVFMPGVEGSGPMGGQPSVFDSTAGDPAWSPYWDHMTYVWKESADARVLATEAEIHDARDAGELDEFPGTPDTGGEIFTVNCPVPVIAPNTFTA
ncbi:MAG TPA: hypothetical protein VF129_03780 [Actinomycetota bacterium]